MTRGKCHSGNISRVPCANDKSTRVGIAFNLLKQIGNLIDTFAISARPRPPLITINRSEIPLLIRPFIPNTHPIFFQISNVGIAF